MNLLDSSATAVSFGGEVEEIVVLQGEVSAENPSLRLTLAPSREAQGTFFLLDFDYTEVGQEGESSLHRYQYTFAVRPSDDGTKSGVLIQRVDSASSFESPLVAAPKLENVVPPSVLFSLVYSLLELDVVSTPPPVPAEPR